MRRPRRSGRSRRTRSSFDEVMDVNVKGVVLCCQVVGGAMAQAGRGSIVNVSSIYGLVSPAGSLRVPPPGRRAFFKPVAYSVSKSALLNLTRYLATYWAKAGVRVNTLTFGGISTSSLRSSSTRTARACRWGAWQMRRGAGRRRLPRLRRLVLRDRRQPRRRRRLVGLVTRPLALTPHQDCRTQSRSSSVNAAQERRTQRATNSRHARHRVRRAPYRCSSRSLCSSCERASSSSARAPTGEGGFEP